LVVEYTVREKCAGKDKTIKILWFECEGKEGNSVIETENIQETIKIKIRLLFWPWGSYNENFHVQVKWASVQRGEVPRSLKNPKFIFLPEATVEGWCHMLGA